MNTGQGVVTVSAAGKVIVGLAWRHTVWQLYMHLRV